MTAFAAEGARTRTAARSRRPARADLGARPSKRLAGDTPYGDAYRIGPLALSLRTTDIRLRRDFHGLYADYAVAAAPPDALLVSVSKRRSPRTLRRTFHISVDGEERFVVASRRAVLPHVEWAINGAAVSTLPGYFQIHAAAVVRNGAALILPAGPGSGKSTLAAGLIHRGWSYLSDEFALIDPQTLHACPFPKALCIKHGSFDRIRRLGLAFSSDQDYVKGVKGRVRFVDPRQLGPQAVGVAAPVRWIVFPKSVGSAAPRLERISRARAAYELARVSFTLARFRGGSLDLLADLAAGAECLVLHAGELSPTCDAIEAQVRRDERGRADSPRRTRSVQRAATPEPSARLCGLSGETAAAARSRDALLRGLAACLAGRPQRVTDKWHHLGLWDRAACLACDLGLGAFLAEALEREGLCTPPSAAATLAAYRRHVAARNAYLETRLRPVLDALTEGGVPFLLLKGAALNASLYGRRDLRGMCDIDLLIHPGDAVRAGQRLTAAGCRAGREHVRPGFFPRFYFEREYWTPDRPPVRLDVHVRPFRPVLYASTVPPDALWDQPQRVELAGSSVLIPHRENMLIHLCVHAACHGLEHLRWTHDIHRFLESNGAALDWYDIERKAKAWRLALPVRRALESVRQTFGATGGVNEDVLSRFDVPAAWLDRLALDQSPHDASRPVRHIVTDVLSLPGWRDRRDYLLATLLPAGSHMASWYSRRHHGWMAAAHALRLMRPLVGRFARTAEPAVR